MSCITFQQAALCVDYGKTWYSRGGRGALPLNSPSGKIEVGPFKSAEIGPFCPAMVWPFSPGPNTDIHPSKPVPSFPVTFSPLFYLILSAPISRVGQQWVRRDYAMGAIRRDSNARRRRSIRRHPKYRMPPGEKREKPNSREKQHKAPISIEIGALLVGEGGFEPPKSSTTDLQSAPFGHSGIPPYLILSLYIHPCGVNI